MPGTVSPYPAPSRSGSAPCASVTFAQIERYSPPARRHWYTSAFAAIGNATSTDAAAAATASPRARNLRPIPRPINPIDPPLSSQMQSTCRDGNHLFFQSAYSASGVRALRAFLKVQAA